MTPIWEKVPHPVPLQRDGAHVWLARLDEPEADMERLTALLSPAEKQRAERFRFAHDRRRFISAHGFLRLLLSAYTGYDAADLRFDVQPFGKPELVVQHGVMPLRFNLSHSHALAVVAVARACEVGVDIEYLRPLDDIATIATHFFSPAECAALLSLPSAQMQTAFFACWSRKEAVIKALGLGLSQPLDEFDVSLLPGAPAQLLDLRSASQSAANWELYDLAPIAGYSSALATATECRQVSCYLWPPGAL